MRIFDFDGVINVNGHLSELAENTQVDVIVTGRCIDEAWEVLSFLEQHGMGQVPVFFNPMLLETRGNHSLKSRQLSANHKVDTIWRLYLNEVNIESIYEDDPIQFEIMKTNLPSNLRSKLIKVESPTEK